MNIQLKFWLRNRVLNSVVKHVMKQFVSFRVSYAIKRWNIFDLHEMRKRKKACLSHYRYHRVKSDQIWSFFWSEYRKMRTRKNSNQKCLTNNALYKASIIPKEENSKTKIYYGVSERAFKLRYASHKKHSIQNYQTNIGIL